MSDNQIKDRTNLVWENILGKAKEVRSDNNTVVMIICLLVAVLFWFLTALNDDYHTEVEFPIEFTDIPAKYEFYGEIPDHITATIEDDGFTIMRYKFAYVFSSLKFDVSKYFKDNEIYNIEGELHISQDALRKGVANELISKSNLVDIQPRNINITYSKLQEKRLPIKVLAEITTEQQHIINGKILTTPDSITVIGSSVVLSDVEEVFTHPIRVLDLKDSLVRNVSLQELDDIEFSEKKVKLCIPVEAFTEKVMEVPIIGLNFPDSLQIRTFPGVSTLSCLCGLSVYKQISPKDFTVFVKYDDVMDKSNGHIDLQFTSHSDYAKHVKLKTPSVDYLIEKR